MIKAYFNNIHLKIIDQIESANSDIKICVAWFTDFDIYTTLVKKSEQGLNIEVIVANHRFNKRSKVDFKDLLKNGGKVGYIGSLTDNSKVSFMHNKFCIIDHFKIITGSYNWTFKARMNDENILLITEEEELTNQFIKKFYELNPQFGFAINNNKVTILPVENIMAKWDKKLTNKKITNNPAKIFKKF